MTCFCLDGRCNEVHVAFKRDEPEQKGYKSEVTYLLFRYQTSQMFTMQFCQFGCTDEVSSVVKSSLNMVNYALILPYSRRDFLFQSQFTLVYSDWDVLLCDTNAPDSKKGHVYVHRTLIEDVLSRF